MRHTVLMGFLPAALLALSAWSQAASAVAGDDWHYSDIVALIEQQQQAGEPFLAPDQLIAAFPDGMRRYFTFVFDTNNKFQAADPLHPRAIVFNHNLIYTFNSGAGQTGGNTIEVMELDQANRKIEMREIVFNSGTDQPAVSYSTSTPDKCLECHGSNPKPIWPAYDNWPGIYGSNDDRMAPAEQANYKTFLASVQGDTTSRYAKLIFPDGSDLTPYSDSTKPSTGFSHRINLVYTKLLTRFNAIRLAGLAATSPFYSSVKWYLPLATDTLGGRLCSLGPALTQQITDSIDAVISQRQLHVGGDGSLYAKLMAVLDIPVSRYNMALDGTTYLYQDGSADESQLFAGLVLQDLTGDDPDLTVPHKAPDAPPNVPAVPDIKVNTQFHASRYADYDLYQYEDSLVGVVSVSSCDRLLDDARTAAAQPLPDPPPPPQGTLAEQLARAEEIRTNPAIPVSCVVCHSVQHDGSAPHLPFDDESALRATLKSDSGHLYQQILSRAAPGAAGSLRMPPPSASAFNALSDKEFGKLRDYISGLQ